MYLYQFYILQNPKGVTYTHNIPSVFKKHPRNHIANYFQNLSYSYMHHGDAAP